MVNKTDEYVFCHTNLDRENILVDPNAFRIVSILDWETADFFSARVASSLLESGRTAREDGLAAETYAWAVQRGACGPVRSCSSTSLIRRRPARRRDP